VAASSDTGDARCAPLGVLRALSRVAVLGGLVAAGWLLGSGISLASEQLGQPGASLVQLASDPGTRTAPSDVGSGGQLGAPPMVSSAVTTVRSTMSLAWRTAQPPVKLGVVQPLVNAVGVPTPPAPALAALPKSATYGAGTRSQAPADEPVTVPPAGPAARAAAPAPTLGTATVLTPVSHATAVRTAADPFAGYLALSDDPTAPVPVSPPASTTSPCMASGTGSGAGTKSAPDVAVNDSWATSRLASMHRPLCLHASDLPRSPAAYPATSPD
jgi:hypothetical protein